MLKQINKIIKGLKQHAILFFILWLMIAIAIVPVISLLIVQGNVYIDQNNAEGLILFSNFKFLYQNFFNVTIPNILREDIIGTYLSTLQVITVIYLIGISVLIYKQKKNEYDKIEYGSASWAADNEQYKILSKTKGITLAKKHYLPVNKPGNTNILVIGGSGAGKSSSFVIPNALNNLGSYIFTDPKGELYDKTAGYFKKNGYKVQVLNLVSPYASDGFNPLLNIKDDLDVDVVAHTVIAGQGDGTTGGDKYWDDNAEQLLKALIYFLLSAGKDEECNLVSCAQLVRMANAGSRGILDDLIDVLDEDHPAVKAYANVRLAPEKAFSSILSTLQSKLAKLESKAIADLICTNTFDFKSVGKEKTALYVISSDTHNTYDFILTIFFSQLIKELYDYADYNGGSLDIPTYFFLDEFANIGQIPDFDKKVSTSRSRKISFNIILQNLDQLEALYKNSYETIMANCDTHLFLGTNSFKTAEYFSKALGQKTIGMDNSSKSKNAKGEVSTSESKHYMARNLMTPDELRRLDVDKCIILVKGIQPVLADKYYYFKDKESIHKLAEKLSNRDYKVERGEWRTFSKLSKEEKEQKEKRQIESKTKNEELKNDVLNLEFVLPEDEKDYKSSAEIVDEIIIDKDEAEKNIEKLEEKGDLASMIAKRFDELFGEIGSK